MSREREVTTVIAIRQNVFKSFNFRVDRVNKRGRLWNILRFDGCRRRDENNFLLIIQSDLQSCWIMQTGRHVVSSPVQRPGVRQLIFGLMMWIDRAHVHVVWLRRKLPMMPVTHVSYSRNEFQERTSQTLPRYAPLFTFYSARG